MRIIALMLLAVSVSLGIIACIEGRAEPPMQPQASEPTPDISATVDASVRGTQEAEAAIDATVQAEVGCGANRDPLANRDSLAYRHALPDGASPSNRDAKSDNCFPAGHPYRPTADTHPAAYPYTATNPHAATYTHPQAELKTAVQEPPAMSGIELANWNWKVVRRFVADWFGVRLCRSRRQGE